MNKEKVIGFVLIAAILFGFSWYGQRKQEGVVIEQARLDSIALVNSPLVESADVEITNSVANQGVIDGVLSSTKSIEKKNFTIENDKMVVTLSNRGGAITSVELKNYKAFGDKPLMLFNEKGSIFNMNLHLKEQINTSNITFENVEQSDSTIVFRLYADSVSYIDFKYAILGDGYLVDFDVDIVGMENVIQPSQRTIDITWANIAPQQEKGFSYESQYVTAAYKLQSESGIEELSAGDNNDEEMEGKVEWVAFKQQFFSSIFVAKGDNFAGGDISYQIAEEHSGDIKSFRSNVIVDYTSDIKGYDFEFYFGPNSYPEMKSYDSSFEKLIPLGWGIIGWINRFIVIPTFDFLSQYISNFGWIILILTILIKLLIFPFTYKSYMSMAKMRLLKPDIDELNTKFPNKDDAMQKQQALMQLYSRAGVSPLGGCLPMLFQMPVLIAMFRFFPASIELRGESFLWANDLSSYDSILQLPFDIPFYGNHVSLFALLMGVSMFISTKVSMSQNSAASSQQVPGMAFMTTYLMPVMLIVWFNSYSSALSYYYLLSNVMTIGQTYLIRQFVDEKKLHEKMKAFANIPKKKNKWQQRYADAIQQQQEVAQTKKNSKK